MDMVCIHFKIKWIKLSTFIQNLSRHLAITYTPILINLILKLNGYLAPLSPMTGL